MQIFEAFLNRVPSFGCHFVDFVTFHKNNRDKIGLLSHTSDKKKMYYPSLTDRKTITSTSLNNQKQSGLFVYIFYSNTLWPFVFMVQSYSIFDWYTYMHIHIQTLFDIIQCCIIASSFRVTQKCQSDWSANKNMEDRVGCSANAWETYLLDDTAWLICMSSWNNKRSTRNEWQEKQKSRNIQILSQWYGFHLFRLPLNILYTYIALSLTSDFKLK